MEEATVLPEIRAEQATPGEKIRLKINGLPIRRARARQRHRVWLGSGATEGVCRARALEDLEEVRLSNGASGGSDSVAVAKRQSTESPTC